MISARAVGSSDDTGSSSTMNLGSVAIARAMPTRCCCPAAIWCGMAVGDAARQAHLFQQFQDPVVALGLRKLGVQSQWFGNDLPDRHLRIERVERLLKDQLHVRPNDP